MYSENNAYLDSLMLFWNSCELCLNIHKSVDDDDGANKLWYPHTYFWYYTDKTPWIATSTEIGLHMWIHTLLDRTSPIDAHTVHDNSLEKPLSP